jgi:hypothetical protein
MKDEARRIIDTLPSEAYYTQDLTLGYVLEGEKWTKHQRLQIIRFTIMLCAFINAYARKAELEPLNRIEHLKAARQIEDLTYPLTGNDTDHIRGAFADCEIAGLYCEAGDVENALTHIESATRHAMHHTEIMDKTNKDGSNYFPWSTSRNLPWLLWEDHLSSPRFDALRGDERFTKCIEQLKANSRELK